MPAYGWWRYGRRRWSAPSSSSSPDRRRQSATGDADGVHLDSTRLMSARSRPVPGTCWLAASCHDARELAQAMRIGADFVVLSPVAATPDHAQAPPLGWQRFASLVEGVNLPVFALGGMGPEHLDDAWQHGAQGIAAIRALWKGSAGEPDAPPREAC
jgi:8-oxo-dGTP diphosphatase